MRELEQFRRVQLELAQKAAGVLRGPSMVTKAEVANAHADADVERLPELVDDCEIQSAGGGWLFMAGVSVLGGPDVLG